MHQVFISYSSKDKSIADAVCRHLEFQGISCWYAPRNILPGRDWVEAIMDAIGEVKVFLLIYSSDSNQSRQVQNEVAAAFNAGCAIVPFRIDDTKMVSKMAYFLNSVHWLDAAGSFPSGYEALSKYIPALLKSTVQSIPVPAEFSTEQPGPPAPSSSTPANALMNVISSASADDTVWLELKLNTDPHQADQQVRGTVLLPRGSGLKHKILVLSKNPLKLQEAMAAGADFAGGEELASRILSQNWTDFDILIASPEMMGTVGRMSPILSPRGLMPSPKAGTVTPNVAAAVREIRAGRIAYRMDGKGCVRCPIGTATFGVEKLIENFAELIQAVSRDKPAAVTGKFILSCTVSCGSSDAIQINTDKYA